MARWRGKTKERGYGNDHQQLRLRLLARWQSGDPCARCGQPMMGPPNRIHLGHTEDRTGYVGLEHADCNTREAARRGNQARRFHPAAGGDVICPGCGKPYHYAARSCEMCGAHYHPSYGEQRTCGRACGLELKRRAKRLTGWLPPAERPKPPPRQVMPLPVCEICGKPCRTRHQRTCSHACGVELKRRTYGGRIKSLVTEEYTCRYCGKTDLRDATAAPGHGKREVCADRECQLARRTENNLVARRGMTREQANAAVLAYRAEGDHRGGPQQAARRQTEEAGKLLTCSVCGKRCMPGEMYLHLGCQSDEWRRSRAW